MTEIDRSPFVEAAQAYWTGMRESARKANAESRKMLKMVASWDKAGVAVEALLPLTGHALPAVRLAAASCLLAYAAAREQALAVLRDLEANDPTLVSTSAGAILRIDARKGLSS